MCKWWKRKTKTEDWESYWNNRRPKISQNYIRHETDGEYYVDVRNFFQWHDANLPVISESSNDEVAYNCLMWVIDNIEYISDKTEYGYEEYWAYAYQVMKRKKDDCDGGAILLANMLLRNKVPYWRVRLVAGQVNGGGHCYVAYCRETDNQFVVLDWCFNPSKLKISDRKLHKNEQNYSDTNKNYGIWFSWNEKFIFGEMETLAGKPDIFE